MDPLAVALSGLCLLALRRPTPRRVELAAVLAVLAVATKQTYLAAGAAGALYLLLRDRRLALRYLLVGSGAAAALAGLATLIWGQGFWFSILVLRDSPVSFATLRAQAALRDDRAFYDQVAKWRYATQTYWLRGWGYRWYWNPARRFYYCRYRCY
jgi:hypothetical protein